MFNIPKSLVLKKLNPKDKKGRYKAEFWLVLIVLFAVALRLWFFVGLSQNDDIFYANFANKIATGNYRPESFYSVRMGVILPMAVFYSIFGVSDFSSSLFFLLSSIGSIVLIFYLGKLLFNHKAGLIGAFILSFFPMDVVYSTQLGPDIPLGFFTALSFFALLLGERRRDKKLFLIAGSLAGFSYLIKSIGALILLAEFGYILYRVMVKRARLSGYLYLIFGFILVLSAEMFYYYQTTGDPLYHYNSDKGAFLNPGFLEHGRNTDLSFIPYSMLNVTYSTYLGGFGYVYWLIIPAVLYGLFKRKGNFFLLSYWTLFLFLYMEFGSMSLTSYVLIDRLPRYLLLISVPSILIISYFLADFASGRKFKILRKTATISLFSFLLATSVYYINDSTSHFNSFMNEVRYSHAYLQTLPAKDVYACSWVDFKLKYYSGFKTNRTRVLNYVNSLRDIKDSYVIINGTWECMSYYQNNVCIFVEGWGPKDTCSIPENWTLLKTIEVPNSKSIYKPKIYYAP